PGKESTFTFLEDVLTEVMDLFPSHYIHIGGDEVLKDRWKACPYCQKRIKDEGLKDEDGLQSYFIKRIDKFVESKGREIVGWDEILQGGLAPGATVQSWRGVDGAIQAAQSKHNTVVSPGDYTYFDKSVNELSLDTVYSFDPVPQSLNADESHFVLGTEANVWTEHVPQDTLDRQAFPRLLALSEVAWTQPQKKNYGDFHNRLEVQYDRLTYLGVDYGLERKAIVFETKLDTVKDEFEITLTAAQAGTQVRYTLDGSAPTLASRLYDGTIIMKGAFELIAQSEMKGRLVGNPVDLTFIISKAINSTVSLKNSYSKKYPAGGAGSLVDGIRGTMDFHDGLWQGYQGVDIDAVIDLGKEKEISQAGAGFYQEYDSWIFMPDSVEFFASNDGASFTNVGVVKNDVPQNDSDTVKKDFIVSFDKRTARYIKMVAKNIGVCPPWHEGAGGKAWLFIDEIFAN
ncbi:MAG: family 20 glycosylhydrolase, partial [Candidatus Kryptoniota bacterium]